MKANVSARDDSGSFFSVIATWGYLNYITANDDALLPIQSPMMCEAIYLKKYLGVEGDIIFYG